MSIRKYDEYDVLIFYADQHLEKCLASIGYRC